MKDHPGFLADILEHPDDDTPRLIYADWLEENGQEERAEFIRVQVELAKTPETIVWRRTWDQYGGVELGESEEMNPVWKELADRVRKLFTWSNLEAWGCHGWERNCLALDEFRQLLPGDFTAALFRRGFVHAVRCPLAAWEEHGPAIVSKHPVERVEATDAWITMTPSVIARTVLEKIVSDLRWEALNGLVPDADHDGILSARLLAWACRIAQATGLYPCSNQDTDIQK